MRNTIKCALGPCGGVGPGAWSLYNDIPQDMGNHTEIEIMERKIKSIFSKVLLLLLFMTLFDEQTFDNSFMFRYDAARRSLSLGFSLMRVMFLDFLNLQIFNHLKKSYFYFRTVMKPNF